MGVVISQNVICPGTPGLILPCPLKCPGILMTVSDVNDPELASVLVLLFLTPVPSFDASISALLRRIRCQCLTGQPPRKEKLVMG